MEESKNFICVECGQEYISKSKIPMGISWSDGHKCERFEEK